LLDFFEVVKKSAGRRRSAQAADTAFVTRVPGDSSALPRRLRRLAVALALILSAGCASAPTRWHPSPFPGADAGGAPAVAHAVVVSALDQRGVPYALGGNRPETGFDCSGLVKYVFAQHRVAVPRTVAEQWRSGDPVLPARAREGDLVFFRTSGSGASHVGIALGDGRFVHAPVSGGVVRVERLDADYWRTRLVGVRRIV
jgi:cell wall-associated NlpC family hydrolase